MGFFEKLGQGLARTRQAVFGAIGQLEEADRITEETYEELEEQLILADVGPAVAASLVQQLRVRVRAEHLATGAEALAALKGLLVELLQPQAPFEPAGRGAGGQPRRRGRPLLGHL